MASEEKLKVRTEQDAVDAFRAKLSEYAPFEALSDGTDDEIAETLCSCHDWTGTGAEELVAVVRKYGSFFLQNAAALAEVLEVQDGEAGF